MAVIFPLVIASLEISIPGNFVKRDDDEGCKGENTEYILEDIYYWVRIGSILLNVVVFAVITIKLRRMAIYKHTTSVSLGDGDTPSKHKSFFSTSSRRTTDVLDEPSAAIHELVRRMKYYPIVQVLVRRYLTNLY